MSAETSGSGERPVVSARLLKASRSAVELWLDAARWWADAVAGTATALHAENERVVAQTADALTRGIQGKRVMAEYGGRPLRAVVESVQLLSSGPEGARLVLREIDWGGLRIERLAVFADEVAITAPPRLVVTLTGIELEGTTTLGEIVNWVDGNLPGWRLGITADHLVEAVHSRHRFGVCLAPAFDRGGLSVELREIRCWRLRLRLPHWLRLTREIPLPPLPEGLAIPAAVQRNSDVEFVMTMPAARVPVDVQGAIRGAGPGVSARQLAPRERTERG